MVGSRSLLSKADITAALGGKPVVETVWRGDYDPDLTYAEHDSVRHQNHSFRADRTVPVQTPPQVNNGQATDSLYWKVLLPVGGSTSLSQRLGIAFLGS